LGWSFGVSNYTGDLSHGSNLPGYHLSGGMYHKHQWNSYFSNRMQVSYLKISGTDKGDRSYAARNLSFQTPIYEFAEMVEFNFQKFGMNHNDKYWTPYFFAGLAGFLFEPTRLENEDIKLRNLKTEGQKKGYSLFQPSIPLGFGIKTTMKAKKNHGIWVFAAEGFWRKTFTDYLDDVNGDYPSFQATADKQGLGSAQYSHAQTLNGDQPYNTGTMRGDQHLKDWYFFLGFTLAYRFPGKVCPSM
jgi:Domain of unknown function (DUF6089)